MAVLVFSSVTYALKAQRVIAGAGINAELIRTARIREIKGCGYGVRVADSDLRTASGEVAEEGIKVLTVINNDGKA